MGVFNAPQLLTMHILGSPDISVLGVLINSTFIKYVANPIPPSSSSVAPIRNNDNSPSPLILNPTVPSPPLPMMRS